MTTGHHTESRKPDHMPDTDLAVMTRAAGGAAVGASIGVVGGFALGVVLGAAGAVIGIAIPRLFNRDRK